MSPPPAFLSLSNPPISLHLQQFSGISCREEIMANSSGESSPLLSNQFQQKGEDGNKNERQSDVVIDDDDNKKFTTKTPIPNSPPSAEMKHSPPPPVAGFHRHAAAYGWTADGLPFANGGVNVMGEPLPRAQWDSGLYACLGRNDEFCSSDLEVCVLGSVAPCVVYGSNVERLGSAPGTFANHCLPYSGLYLIGNSFFGWNCMAPWFSYPTRTAIRKKFNLEGDCEALNKSCGGCCNMIVNDEQQLEQAEVACDFATHVFCHPCAICQEGREVRRRLPHPGFHAQPMPVLTPPGEQSMARHA